MRARERERERERVIKVCAHRNLRVRSVRWCIQISRTTHGDCCKMQIFQFSPRSLICHTDWCDLISSLDSDCNQFWTLCAHFGGLRHAGTDGKKSEEFLSRINHGRGAAINSPRRAPILMIYQKSTSAARETRRRANAPQCSSLRFVLDIYSFVNAQQCLCGGKRRSYDETI